MREDKKFTIRYNKEKNRVYAKLSGFWTKKSIAQSYLEECDFVLGQTYSPFTAIIDVSEFKIPKPEILEYIKRSQQDFMKAGMSKSAELVAKNLFADISIEKIKKMNQMDNESRKKFHILSEAEEWLDSA